MKKHNHKFQFGGFEASKESKSQLYLFCQCGAIENIILGYINRFSNEILITEPPKNVKNEEIS